MHCQLRPAGLAVRSRHPSTISETGSITEFQATFNPNKARLQIRNLFAMESVNPDKAGRQRSMRTIARFDVGNIIGHARQLCLNGLQVFKDQRMVHSFGQCETIDARS